MKLLRIPPVWVRYERWGVGFVTADPPVAIEAPDPEKSKAAIAALIGEGSEEWRAEREAMRDYQ